MNVDQEFKEEQSQETVLELLPEEELQLGEPLQQESDSSQEKTEVSLSGAVKEFLLSLEKIESVEERIRQSIDFMKSRLIGSVSPKFREFWEVRKLCLPLFKENITPKLRADFWGQYIDLSVEARRLKEILDEQSAFAYEQIDLAVQSLVRDLDSYEERLTQIADLDVPQQALSLIAKSEVYNHTQKQLNLLNALAAKVNALRKEVIKTDMRIRSKNKLFEKLSECGDRIFPKRKDLIRQISQDFSGDVLGFYKKYFELDSEPSVSLHLLREEIKALQSFAKYLTLNTQSFTDTRLQLSSCWDKLKTWDKEKKKELTHKKLQQKQSYDEALLKVKEFEEFCKDQTSLSLVEEKHRDVLQSLKGFPDLGWGEFRQLREALSAARNPLEEKEKQERLALQAQEKALEAERLQKIQDLKEEFQVLIQKADTFSLDDLLAQKEILEEKCKPLSSVKSEKMWIDRSFKQLKDRILEVKSSRLLSLSHSDQERYAELKNLIREKKERRSEVKGQLELYRKALGGSSFDFEKGMMYQEMIESEKLNLEKMNLAIQELEEKIAEIEG